MIDLGQTAGAFTNTGHVELFGITFLLHVASREMMNSRERLKSAAVLRSLALKNGIIITRIVVRGIRFSYYYFIDGQKKKKRPPTKLRLADDRDGEKRKEIVSTDSFESSETRSQWTDLGTFI